MGTKQDHNLTFAIKFLVRSYIGSLKEVLMPELYGQPRKDELRKEIRELNNELFSKQRELNETRQSLDFARARIALMTTKAQSLEQKLGGLLADASREISGREVVEEAKRIKQARLDKMTAAYEAQAATAATQHEG
jgi:hypothetical protein